MDTGLYPSIYDLDPQRLAACDWSRPLFVQAARQAHFDEVVSVVISRMRLDPSRVTALVARSWTPGPLDLPIARVANPSDRLSEATLRSLGPLVREASTVLLVTGELAGNGHQPVKSASNLMAFAHAAGRPMLVVDGVGLLEDAEPFFCMGEREVGGHRFYAQLSMRDGEAGLLAGLVTAAPPGAIVEIGRFTGGSAVLLARAARAAGRPPVWSIDCRPLDVAHYFFAVNGVSDHIRCLDGDSADLAARWREAQADPGIAGLFIDADHSYDGVARDIAHWAPFLVPGGLIAFHDANQAGMGVSRAIYRHVLANPGFGQARQVQGFLMAARTSASLSMAA